MKLTSGSEVRALFAAARRRIRTFTVGGTFAEACAFVIGYDCASGEDLLKEFQGWLGERHEGRSELAFWVHVLTEAFPGSPAVRVLDLTNDQNRIAIDKLFELLDECLADLQSKTDGQSSYQEGGWMGDED